jgi:hypothetical protein
MSKRPRMPRFCFVSQRRIAQDPFYAANSSVLRPLSGNYSSPARETVANIFMLKQPIGFAFMATLKL